ncbi:MAG: protein-ADP-ribose hydrolase [Lachnospiraceae bacterium]|nr:protein-ADP-ribose hydrolase [Lachnospiraceae bacterium]
MRDEVQKNPWKSFYTETIYANEVIHVNQEQRLDYLVGQFKEDSVQYKNLEVGASVEEKRIALRSLMNIRMPRALPEEVERIQDAYLKERAAEKGIVKPEDIPTIDKDLHSTHPYAKLLSVWQGDITRLSVDAIVNAANSQMLGCFRPMHTCIDNCIHTFAGVQLRQECSRQMNEKRMQYGRAYEQPAAQPMLTGGYNLPAKYVVHIVGPIVEYRLTAELEQALADCYSRTLDCCLQNNIRSVAFCCISTGVFRFPNDRAAEIAVGTVTKWLSEHPGSMDRIIFNVFKDEDKSFYEEQLS